MKLNSAFQCTMVATGFASTLKNGEVVTEPQGPPLPSGHVCCVKNWEELPFSLHFILNSWSSCLSLEYMKTKGREMVLGWEESDIQRLLPYLSFVMLCPFFFLPLLNWMLLVLGIFLFTVSPQECCSPKVCPVSESTLRLDASGWGDLNSFSVTRCSLALSPALSFNSLISVLIRSQPGDCSLW